MRELVFSMATVVRSSSSIRQVTAMRFLFVIARRHEVDSTCHIWDVLTGEIVNVIQLNTPIRCLAVSEGDQYLCLCTMSFAGEAVFHSCDD